MNARVWSATTLVAVIAGLLCAAIVAAGAPWWAVGIVIAAGVCWVASTAAARLERVQAAAWFAAAGALLAAAMVGVTDGNTVAIVALCLFALIGHPEVPLRWAIGVAGAVVIEVCVGILLQVERWQPIGLIVMALAVLAGSLGGYVRRQNRVAALLAEEAREREERARASETRVAAARDIHDVLAHSLGGLVLQLDAADALLEAGRVEDGRDRVRASLELARSGLADVRGVVAALRGEPEVEVEPVSAIADLVAAHRALGGTATLTTIGEPFPLTQQAGIALVRAAQESLANARRHAPGAPVTATLRWEDRAVELSLSSPLVRGVHAAGSGRGLIGMRERFAALPGGHASAAASGGAFEVRVGCSA